MFGFSIQRDNQTHKSFPTKTVLASLIVVGALCIGHVAASPTMEGGVVDRIIASWPERPRLGAREMIAKYGTPQEVTISQLIWRNQGPYKRITVYNLETPHDFPLPHVDFLEHTIVYDVPQDKVGALIEFDASSTINRTVGELSARCDLEGHNILTLNLDHDIVTGKMTVAQARKAFGDIVGQDVKGEHPAYVEGLVFTPAKGNAAEFSDKPLIPGSPVRAEDLADAPKPIPGNRKGDAEVLALVIAVDLNEVLAAAAAQKKKMSGPATDYARMLHQEHGKHMVDTMMLGGKIGVTPIDTAAVDRMKRKGAGELAGLVPLDGGEFERGYITAMINGHREVLGLIDGELMNAAKDASLKAHLVETRKHIAMHLAKAEALQSSMKR